MPVVDSSLDIWLGGRNEDAPRLLHYYDGFYWLVCLDLFSKRVEIWKIGSAEGSSFVAQSVQIQGNRTNQQGWEQIDSAPHWNFEILPALRLGYIRGPTGNSPFMVFAGFDMDQEQFEFYDIGPLAGFFDIGSLQYVYANGEALKPIKVGVLPAGVNSSRTYLLFGDEQQAVGTPHARARLQYLTESTGVPSSGFDVSGLTATGLQVHSYPRAAHRNPISSTVLDLWVTQDSSAGVALFHQYVTGVGAQGTASRLTPYWPVGEWIEVGLPWHTGGGARQAIPYARGSTDEYFVHYGPSASNLAWSQNAKALPDPPNPQTGGGSLYCLVGIDLDSYDTVYAIGYNSADEPLVIYRTQEDGEGVFSAWEEVLTGEGAGPIVSMAVASTEDGSEVCIVYEHNPEGSSELGRQVFYNFGQTGAGSLSGPGGSVGGFGDGKAFYAS